jgi:hypothetical protein
LNGAAAPVQRRARYEKFRLEPGGVRQIDRVSYRYESYALRTVGVKQILARSHSIEPLLLNRSKRYK